MSVNIFNVSGETAIVRGGATIVLIISALVLLGWKMDAPVLKSVISEWVSMKVPTALSLWLGSTMLMVMTLPRVKWAMMFISACSWLLLLMVFQLAVIASYGMTLNFIFPDDSNFTVTPQMPSLVGLLCITMIGVAGIVWLYNTQKCERRMKIIAYALFGVGIVGVMGYLFGMPALYYYWPSVSTGMSAHTAFCMAVIGLCIHSIAISECPNKKEAT